MHPHDPRSIAFVGSYVPRRCGIATFTHDLRAAVAAHLPAAACPVLPVNGPGPRPTYPDEVRFECDAADPAAFVRAAEFLNLTNIDVVSLQHEYGIFGGEAGSHVLGLMRELRAPIHTTLHTVLARPSPSQKRVMDDVIHLSARLAVMTDRGRDLLRDVYDVAAERIDVIPHGIPDMPFIDPAFHKDRFGLGAAKVLLTFGLLSPGKGIENVIAALPAVVARHPDVVYVVLGATHPLLLQEQGEAYREGLVALAERLGVRDRVLFDDRFVDLPDLLSWLGAADLYVTPYLGEDQVTSGTLAYAFGCGKAVISTPYWHARELLADGRGVLVPFRDPEAIAEQASLLLADDPRRAAIRKRAWEIGRGMTWSSVAGRYAESYRRARDGLAVKPRRHAAPIRPARQPLPPVVLEHLWRLTDSTGLLQHATHDVPNFSEGYCTDDNARALALMVMLEDLGADSADTHRAAGVYAAFLDHAFVAETGRFRNFLGYDRRWLDAGGSDDCLGRAVLALGACVGRSRRPGLARWAMRLFAPAVRAAQAATSPRAWALAIVGIQEYLRRLDGDRLAASLRRDLTARLIDCAGATATPDWPWLEDSVTYDNGRLCQALIVSGRWTGDARPLDTGLRMLAWLVEVQRSPAGRFAPVGCRGFLQRGGERAAFDQQPLEAQAMVAACIEAFHATGDRGWLEHARNAFEWFRGHNVLGIGLCDPRTGGCRDGLLVDRANENQGAESTLAWLGALVDMTSVARTIREPRTPAAQPHRTARPSGSPCT
jgi:glycosyltransferase involved in cell wall biosynthesis